jgi:aromatic ring-cleaving dioxygenase
MTENRGYHAHIYYDAGTRPIAERLRETIAAKFVVRVGDLSDEPRGPHPISQFAVIIEAPEFQNIVPWLMLVHPLTESSYDDHSKHALWLGTPVPMRLDILRPSYSPDLLPGGARWLSSPLTKSRMHDSFVTEQLALDSDGSGSAA